MKKIIFACCAMCFLTGVAFGGDKKCGVECDDNHDKYLLCSESGKKVISIYPCANDAWLDPVEGTAEWCKDKLVPDNSYISYSNWSVNEGSRLYVKKSLQKNGTGYWVDGADISNNTNFCVACQQGYKYDSDAGKCVNEKEAVIKPECKLGDPNCNQNPRSAQLAHPCPEGKKQYDECLSGNSKAPSNATKARCAYLQAKPNEAQQLTCAATECKDGYLLWLNKNGNSMGICHTEQRAKEFCSTGCGNCKPNQECVPWIVDTPSNLKINGQSLVPKKNGAYRECHCVDKTAQTPAPTNEEADCTYKFSVFCNDRINDASEIMSECSEESYPKTIGFTQDSLRQVKDKYGLTDDEIEECADKKVMTFENSAAARKIFAEDVKKVEKYMQDAKCKKKIKDFCEGQGGGSGGSGGGTIVIPDDHSREIDDAKAVLSAFFKSTRDNRTVWRTMDGKFNAARLASDLTAGVVLGTVGGVVSGVVIKKKQVEKGFDALHCAIGGQNVADWGDEFRVGLQ